MSQNDTVYNNQISIKGMHLPLVFASTELTYPHQNGRWETVEEEDAIREYILPNGLKVNEAIANLWLENLTNQGIQSLPDTTYNNSITITESRLPFLFASIVFGFAGQLGRWETVEEEDAVKEYILPNGLKVSQAIADKWLEYNNAL